MSKTFYHIDVRGRENSDGTRFATFMNKDQVANIRLEKVLRDARDTTENLLAQGYNIIGQGFLSDLRVAAQSLTSFEPAEIAEAVGWTGTVFCKPNGSVIVPKASQVDGLAPPGTAFFRFPERNSSKGKLARWREIISTLIASSDIARVLIGLALAPAVRSLLSTPVPAFGTQLLVEGRQTAPSDILLSVIGSMRAGSLRCDTIPELNKHPERYVDASQDHLLVLDSIGSYLAGASDKKRKTSLRTLTFDHLIPVGGGEDNAHGSPAPLFVAVVAIALEELLDLDDNAATLLRENLLTIKIPKDEFGGVVPGQSSAADNGVSSTMGSCAEALLRCRSNYGVGLDAFLHALVERRADDPEKLQRDLEGWFSTFEQKAARYAEDVEGGERVVQQFALIFATLRLASELEVLPKVPDTGQALIRVCKQALRQVPKPANAAALLTEIAAHPDVLRLEDVGGLGEEKLKTVPAFIKTLKSGKRELWLSSEQRKELFDWRTFKKLSDFSKWFVGKGEKDHLGAKKTIGTWEVRVVRFRLPA
jgi:hypothetical protein